MHLSPTLASSTPASSTPVRSPAHDRPLAFLQYYPAALTAARFDGLYAEQRPQLAAYAPPPSPPPPPPPIGDTRWFICCAQIWRSNPYEWPGTQNNSQLTGRGFERRVVFWKAASCSYGLCRFRPDVDPRPAKHGPFCPSQHSANPTNRGGQKQARCMGAWVYACVRPMAPQVGARCVRALSWYVCACAASSTAGACVRACSLRFARWVRACCIGLPKLVRACVLGACLRPPARQVHGCVRAAFGSPGGCVRAAFSSPSGCVRAAFGSPGSACVSGCLLGTRCRSPPLARRGLVDTLEHIFTDCAAGPCVIWGNAPSTLITSIYLAKTPVWPKQFALLKPCSARLQLAVWPVVIPTLNNPG
jgi:hypothetical protein